MAVTQHEGFNLSFVMNFSGSCNCLFPDFFFKKGVGIFGLQEKTKLLTVYISGDVLRPHLIETGGPKALKFLPGMEAAPSKSCWRQFCMGVGGKAQPAQGTNGISSSQL